MLSTRPFLSAMWAIVAIGCGDDGGMILDAGARDAGSDAGRLDAGEPGSRDTGVEDADTDAGLCPSGSPSGDPREYGSVRDDWTFFDSVALVPLDLLVSSGHASTLDDFDNYGACTDDVDSGVDWGDWEDGGNFVSTLRRTTGCGTVVFENFAPNWNRLWVFDAETGKLVAYGRLDDVGTPPCGNAAYIAGAKRAPCATDVVEVCR